MKLLIGGTAAVLVLGLAATLAAQSLDTNLNTVAVTAQPPSVQQPFSMQPDLTPPEVPDNYRVGPEDLLAIFVYQMPELSSQVRVSNRGAIRLPMLPRSLPIAGLTAPQIGRVLATDLRRQGLARDPVVRVVVRQVMSHPVVVAGAVAKPVVIEATRPLRLIEALTRAGGPSKEAGTEILVTTQGPDGTTSRKIALQAVTDTADPVTDPLLTGGEVIRVLPAQYVYAVGALEKPNAFPVLASSPMTVLRMLALAQGVSSTEPANLKHSVIIRTVSGRRVRIAVNLKSLLQHATPDIPLQAGDIFYVPVNGKSKFFDGVLGMAAQATTIALGYRVF